VSGQDDITAGSNSDTLTLEAGTGIALTTNSSDKTITITATGGGGGGGSQWSSNGSDIYYSLGNVGIGTSTPGEALSVSGDANISGATSLGSTLTVSSTIIAPIDETINGI